MKRALTAIKDAMCLVSLRKSLDEMWRCAARAGHGDLVCVSATVICSITQRKAVEAAVIDRRSSHIMAASNKTNDSSVRCITVAFCARSSRPGFESYTIGTISFLLTDCVE